MRSSQHGDAHSDLDQRLRIRESTLLDESREVVVEACLATVVHTLPPAMPPNAQAKVRNTAHPSAAPQNMVEQCRQTHRAISPPFAVQHETDPLKRMAEGGLPKFAGQLLLEARKRPVVPHQPCNVCWMRTTMAPVSRRPQDIHFRRAKHPAIHDHKRRLHSCNTLLHAVKHLLIWWRIISVGPLPQIIVVAHLEVVARETLAKVPQPHRVDGETWRRPVEMVASVAMAVSVAAVVAVVKGGSRGGSVVGGDFVSATANAYLVFVVVVGE